MKTSRKRRTSFSHLPQTAARSKVTQRFTGTMQLVVDAIEGETLKVRATALRKLLAHLGWSEHITNSTADSYVAFLQAAIYTEEGREAIVKLSSLMMATHKSSGEKSTRS